MRSSFIAAGGVLLAAAAMATAMVGTAVADDDRHGRASLCVLDASQDATWLRIDHHSVTAGTRDAEACKGRVVYDEKDDDDDDDKDRHHHHEDWEKPNWWGLDG
ncbi:hypothetical protein [Nonomuraea sp. LPB2021202275-12-8]|uniref:hypothetical protein n=1 Tax=Nonomuraea sp. LPB2021202275-12-8 TaxID=3120159 RepID=UPI00300C8FF6